MSSSVTKSDNKTTKGESKNHASPFAKGKSKVVDPSTEESMEEEEEEEEEEGDGEVGSDEDEEEEDFEEIDPTAIVGRRTRGVRVDYTSKEAMEKAGLKANEEDEDSDEDVEMKD